MRVQSGRLAVLLALFVLSSCHQPTQRTSARSLDSQAGASGFIALSGNGEAYGGGDAPLMFPDVYERSPRFSCAGDHLGYSSRIVHNDVDDSVIWSTDPCDSQGDVAFPSGSDFLAAEAGRISSVSGHFFAAAGRIFETPPPSGISEFNRGTYQTEAWCQPEVFPLFGNTTEVTIQLDPNTGARTATVYLLWKADDPITHLPLPFREEGLSGYVWVGQSAPFPVTRSDSGGGLEFSSQDFALTVDPLTSSDPYVRAGHLRVTLYGLTSRFDLACIWAGK